jgi:protein SCO1/2
MRTSAPLGIEDPAKSKIPGDWLQPRDRQLVLLGVAAAIVLAAGLAFLIVGLGDSGSPPAVPGAIARAIPPDYPRRLVDFSFTDQQGHPVTRRDLDGKIVVVNFLFTSCSIVCPYVDAQMEKIQAATAGSRDVRLVTLSLDAVDDAVKVLGSYAPRYHADPARWSFLTGDQAAMHNLIATSFLPPDTTGEFSFMPGNFAHTERIVLVDKTGRIVSYFDGLNPNAAEGVVERAKGLEDGS